MNYAAWPTLADIEMRLNSNPGTASVWKAANPALAAHTLAAVLAEVTERTKRQFVPDTQDQTRVYDGTGTPELEIDEILSLTGVTAVGFQENPGYPLSDAQVAQAEIGKPATRLIMSRGGVPAWGPAAVMTPMYAIFPVGRQNIAVTGRFGYASAIPADLWNAVCGEIAVRLVRAGLFVPEGRLSSESYGDEKRSYALPDADALGWHQEFDCAVNRYKRSQGKRLRRLRGAMIEG